MFADVIREGSNNLDGDDDKIYYFFTEVSVEYEFFGKLLIPRIARVCKVSLMRFMYTLPSYRYGSLLERIGDIYLPLLIPLA